MKAENDWGRGVGGRWRYGTCGALQDFDLEDWNVVLNLGFVALGDALGDPHDVPRLTMFHVP
jgi:hypothetical protein